MSAKIYVGNLQWSVREEDLGIFMVEKGLTFRKVEILLEPDPAGGGKIRSRGFGFVHFDTDEEAGRARDGLSGVTLRGRVLKVDLATARQMVVEPGGGRRGAVGSDLARSGRRGGGQRGPSPDVEIQDVWRQEYFPDPNFDDEEG